MGCANHHTLRGNAEFFSNQFASLCDHPRCRCDEVYGDQNDFGLSVIEHGRFGPEWVMHVGGVTHSVITSHRCRSHWGDIRFAKPDSQRLLQCVAGLFALRTNRARQSEEYSHPKECLHRETQCRAATHVSVNSRAQQPTRFPTLCFSQARRIDSQSAHGFFRSGVDGSGVCDGLNDSFRIRCDSLSPM